MSSANETFSFPKIEVNKTLLHSQTCNNINTESYLTPTNNTTHLTNANLKSETPLQCHKMPSNTLNDTLSESKTHKRGTGSSAFNSDSTLVDNLSIIPRTSSSSSEVSSTSTSSSTSTYRTLPDTQNLTSLVISEEVKDTDVSNNIESFIRKDDQQQQENYFEQKNNNIYKKQPYTPTIDLIHQSNSSTPGPSQSLDYFAQNLNSSSRGISNRSINLLGHRTSKSENFTLKLPKKADLKPTNQLNLLQEETCSNELNGNSNFENALPSAPLMSENSSGSKNFSSSSSSPISSSFNFSLFRKQPNQSTSKNDPKVELSIPVRHSLKLKSTHLKLPDEIDILRLENAEAQILQWSASLGLDGLSNLLIIDLRPFHNYCKSHITGAINVCLPSTLLKRQTFTLQKCIQTLTEADKNLFEDYLKRPISSLPRVLFYDDYNSTEDNISSSIFHLSKKFIQTNSWNSKLYILEGGFDKCNETFKSTQLGKESNSDNIDAQSVANTSALSVNSGTFSPSITLSSPHSLISPGNCLVSKPKKLGSAQTPLLSTSFPTESKTMPPSHISLSRFVLPEERSPVFKTKNYDEVLSDKADLSIHLSTELSPYEINALPTWLSEV